MNTPVSFELAKLLREKGFDVKDKENHYFYVVNHADPKKFSYLEVGYGNDILAPTIAEVVMWLYEKHGIWIYTVKDYDMPKFNYAIQQPNVYSVLSYLHNDFNSPTEAYEAAIEYTLNNLI